MAHGMKSKKGRVFEVLDKDPDLSCHQIAERFGIPKTTASTYISEWRRKNANQD